MGLTRGDFAAFFAEVHGVERPHEWQERLLDHLLEHGRWPDRIDAPTGSGKTAVIDVHVFAQALTAGAVTPNRLPRRLAMVVNRRVLVDDQYRHALHLAARLERSREGSSVLAEVAGSLLALRPAADSSATMGGAPEDGTRKELVGSPAPEPLVVARLRGGTASSTEWRDDPRAAAVICATPDMWGSRLLFRGYGASSRAWPREAGLLAMDAVVVVDESHLSQQLLVTARRVRELSTGEVASIIPMLQVVEASATPGKADDGTTCVGVTEVDLASEGGEELRRRLTRPKPVRLVPVAGWTATRGPQRRTVANALADEVVSLVEYARANPRSREGATMAPTVGCYVNTVGRAVDVANELEARKVDGKALSVVTVCGQVRPVDVRYLRKDHDGLLSVKGNSEVDVIVTTQSLEVGIDLDLSAVVTDLAPGSAIAQRAGRVNRQGAGDRGHVVVVGPDGDGLQRELRSGPYGNEELRSAWDWLRTEMSDDVGLSPWRIRSSGYPSAPRRRMLYQRPEYGDVLQWTRTSDALAAEPELDLWLEEDLEEDTSVGLVVRKKMPADPDDARRLVADMGTLPGEVFTIPYRTARTLLEDRELMHRPVVRVRGDDVAVVPTGEVEGRRDVRPGDVLVVDSGARIFTRSRAADVRSTPPVVVPLDEGDQLLTRHTADDVYRDAALDPELGRARRVFRIEPECSEIDGEGLRALAEGVLGANDQAKRKRVADWLALQTGASAALAEAIGLNKRGTLPRQTDVIVHESPDAEGDGADVVRVLVVDRRRSFLDQEVRQVWSPAVEGVTLDDHQAAVARRAVEWAEGLRLPDAWVDALRQAGLHHDDGKADRRFQERLGAQDASELMAKSAGMPSAVWKRSLGGLPARWRHEQYSVVRSWNAIETTESGIDRSLTARLIGTSHGHGRVCFPHTADGLLLPEAGAEEWSIARTLFDEGEWDGLIEQTDRRYGLWGCAYLEALLRGADCTVSGEGR